MRTIGSDIEYHADTYAISSSAMSEAPEFIRVKRRRDEDSVQALRMFWLTENCLCMSYVIVLTNRISD